MESYIYRTVPVSPLLTDIVIMGIYANGCYYRIIADIIFTPEAFSNALEILEDNK